MASTSTNTNLIRLQNAISKPTSLHDRLQREKHTAASTILLLDASYSMESSCDNSQRRIDALWEAVQALRAQGQQFRTAVFNDHCYWQEDTMCPLPRGGTDLTRAFAFIAIGIKPSTITLITDGYPNNGPESLIAAEQLGCKVNVLYVGPSSDTYAQAFCRQLASQTGGQFIANSLSTAQLQLTATTTIAGLLASPTEEKKAIQL